MGSQLVERMRARLGMPKVGLGRLVVALVLSTIFNTEGSFTTRGFFRKIEGRLRVPIDSFAFSTSSPVHITFLGLRSVILGNRPFVVMENGSPRIKPPTLLAAASALEGGFASLLALEGPGANGGAAVGDVGLKMGGRTKLAPVGLHACASGVEAGAGGSKGDRGAASGDRGAGIGGVTGEVLTATSHSWSESSSSSSSDDEISEYAAAHPRNLDELSFGDPGLPAVSLPAPPGRAAATGEEGPSGRAAIRAVTSLRLFSSGDSLEVPAVGPSALK